MDILKLPAVGIPVISSLNQKVTDSSAPSQWWENTHRPIDIYRLYNLQKIVNIAILPETNIAPENRPPQ